MSTSDSVDRVFTHALATVRRLPRTGSSRPPPSARLRLYGLYKQSMEGDVAAILPRPVLPLPPSPPPTTTQHDLPNISSTIESDPPSPPLTRQDSATSQPGQGQRNQQQARGNQNTAVHRFASRDLRTREAQAEIEKWDAWHACAGMSRTEAKRAYIEALIQTMKEYASGTVESRELVGELEFVWGQIRSQDGSGSGSGGSARREGGVGGRGSGGGGSGEDEEGESPRRSGMLGLSGTGSGTKGSGGSRPSNSDGKKRRRHREELASDGGRLRVLSPMSPRGGSEIVEGRDVDDEDEDVVEGGPDDRSLQRGPAASRFAALESQLRHLSTEIAALREQLSANHLLSSGSSSYYGQARYDYARLSLKWKIYYRFVSYLKWIAWLVVRQAVFAGMVLGFLVVWERWKGRGQGKERERRVEEWVRRRWKDLRQVFLRLGWEDWGSWLVVGLGGLRRGVGFGGH